VRIISGTARGTRLAPVPRGVRPTSDRVRESLFNRLGQFFAGGEVLDLFAGTGALGIEALSRGCERAVFVDRSGAAVRTIRENLRRCGFEERAEVIRGDVGRVLDRLPRNQQFHLIFLDPPYRISRTELERLLGRMPGFLHPAGRVVLESGASRHDAGSGAGESYRYGGTTVTIYDGSDLNTDVAICPGSFDPLTSGHLEIIRRAASIFGHVVVAVGGNIQKRQPVSKEERARMIERATKGLENVSVEVMDGLLVDFAREHGARVIVKGLRAVSDFESEFVQAQVNRKLYPELETIFIMASSEHSFLSSSVVREVASYGGDIKGLVPDEILDTVREIYSGAGK
jgi:pantetheine-phosphate adenylyltransferase/16S rRNA (guanine(966)-N(2))-methyltransferase RsmD